MKKPFKNPFRHHPAKNRNKPRGYSPTQIICVSFVIVIALGTLLLSLPIPLRVIISSRLVTVYLMGLMYSAVVIVPAVVVYWIQVAHSAAVIVGGLLTVAIVSLIVLLLSCLLGWVVAKISLKLKHKSITTVLVSLLGIGLYYFIYFKAQTVISDLVANAVVYGVKIKGAAYPLYLFGRMAEGDWTAMALVSAAVVLLTALTWLLLSRSFLRLATSGGSAAKARYREKKARVRSLPAALLGKECRRFVSSPNYMLNCGMGVLMIPAAGVLLLLKGGEWLGLLKAVLPGADSVLAALAISVACLLASMNDMAAPSVSLEGKSLWVLQSLPVSAWEVLKAKLKMQLVFTGIPMLVFLACALPVLGLSPVLSLLTAAGSLLAVLLLALFGLTMGLKMPNLHWTSEITPVKQGGSVALALLGGWAYALLPGGAAMALGRNLHPAVIPAVFCLLTAVLCALLYVWLKNRGAKVFAAL